MYDTKKGERWRRIAPYVRPTFKDQTHWNERLMGSWEEGRSDFFLFELGKKRWFGKWIKLSVGDKVINTIWYPENCILPKYA